MQTREFYIAGVKFHDLPKVIDSLIEGDLLDLVPEPENKFDSNAVAIKINGTMLGYVPKQISAEVSAAIEACGEENVKCEITILDSSASPWQMCKVKVYEIESDDDETCDDYEKEDD
jgi:hypothetical protein